MQRVEYENLGKVTNLALIATYITHKICEEGGYLDYLENKQKELDRQILLKELNITESKTSISHNRITKWTSIYTVIAVTITAIAAVWSIIITLYKK